jgi:hypothetical protein
MDEEEFEKLQPDWRDHEWIEEPLVDAEIIRDARQLELLA